MNNMEEIQLANLADARVETTGAAESNDDHGNTGLDLVTDSSVDIVEDDDEDDDKHDDKVEDEDDEDEDEVDGESSEEEEDSDWDYEEGDEYLSVYGDDEEKSVYGDANSAAPLGPSQSTSSGAFTAFAKMPAELRTQVWQDAKYDAAVEPPLGPRTIVVTEEADSKGHLIYVGDYMHHYRVSNVNNLRDACRESGRIVGGRTPQLKYLFPNLDGPPATPIVFEPLRDTLLFHSDHFPNKNDVKVFLERLTEEERSSIRKIAFYCAEQAWFDMEELPAAETLLMMQNLDQVTYLEDRRNARDGRYNEEENNEWRSGKAAVIARDLMDDHEFWDCPEFEFKIDPFNPDGPYA